jgi:hypothetical protein
MVALRLGQLIENKKIERGMGRLHCGGRLLIGGHNNQMKVVVDIGGDVEEERRSGRNVWGVLSPGTGRRIEGEKNRK